MAGRSVTRAPLPLDAAHPDVLRLLEAMGRLERAALLGGAAGRRT